MTEPININPPEKVLTICRGLHDAGFEAYIVGGAVRDSIIGRLPNDWDIATNALPHQVTALFSRVVDTGLIHGTVSVIVDGEGIEVTTYRVDGDYSDGRRPDSVEFAKHVTLDLGRRDFTINAIAYDPISGAIIDPFDGIGDIKRSIVRAVGDANERFDEDSLRGLRALRFAAVLDFDIDTSTLSAVMQCRLRVSVERCRIEIVKGLASKKPSRFVLMLFMTGLLDELLPELLPMFGCNQNKYHEFDVWGHTLRVLDASPNEQHMRLAALFHDIGKPSVKGSHPVTGEATFYDHETVGSDMTDAIMRRLKFSNDEREKVVHLVRHHLVPDIKSPSSIRRWVRKGGPDNVSDVIALAKADCAGKGSPRCPGSPVTYLDDLAMAIAAMGSVEPLVTNATQLAIDGNDVMVALGIGPGKEVGRALRWLLELVLDHPELNNRDALLFELGQIASIGRLGLELF
jgi:tRNA nucleotidyltransferase (CCA-adding enzyme)